jgi:hypothetical protein
MGRGGKSAGGSLVGGFIMAIIFVSVGVQKGNTGLLWTGVVLLSLYCIAIFALVYLMVGSKMSCRICQERHPVLSRHLGVDLIVRRETPASQNPPIVFSAGPGNVIPIVVAGEGPVGGGDGFNGSGDFPAPTDEVFTASLSALKNAGDTVSMLSSLRSLYNCTSRGVYGPSGQTEARTGILRAGQAARQTNEAAWTPECAELFGRILKSLALVSSSGSEEVANPDPAPPALPEPMRL